MSDFEFTFALFGLLLGLSLAEVLAGLARALEARLRLGRAVRIGWLSPLLGAFVLLDLLSFWQAAWVARDVIRVSGLTLLAVLGFAGAYYLAAALVFPKAMPEGPEDGEGATPQRADLDAHFFRVRRLVIGVMLALLLVQLCFYLSVPALAPRLHSPLAAALAAILAALMLTAMLTRTERWTRLAMLALVARYVVVYLL